MHERIRYEYYQQKYRDYPVYQSVHQKSDQKQKNFERSIVEHKIKDFENYSSYLFEVKCSNESEKVVIPAEKMDSTKQLVAAFSVFLTLNSSCPLAERMPFGSPVSNCQCGSHSTHLDYR